MNTKKNSLIKWGLMITCFAVVVITAVCVLPNHLNQQDVTPSNSSNKAINDTENKNSSQVTSEIHISINDIVMNQVDGFQV